MSIQYMDAFVDERYGNRFIETLFERNWLIDGVTYTSEYSAEGGAGRYIYHKQLDSQTNLPEEVGTKYNPEMYANEEVTLTLLNQYTEYLEIPYATEAATDSSVIENTVKNQARKIAVRQMRSALACLITEAGHKDFGKSALTTDNIRERILAAATEGVSELGDIDTILTTPENYAKLIEVLPKSQITPIANEEIVKNGVRLPSVQWGGINIYSVPGLSNRQSVQYAYKTMNGTSKVTKTVEAATIKDVNFIAYNRNTFAVNTLISKVRAFDSPDSPAMIVTSVATNGFGLIYPEHVIIDTASASE